MNSAFWAELILRIIVALISRLDDEALRKVKTACNTKLLEKSSGSMLS